MYSSKINFDVRDYCQGLKATKPPYECPVDGCGKVYKSYCGIQFHLYNFDHSNPESNTPTPVKKPGRKRGRWHHRSLRRSPTPPEFLRPPARETLTYAEAQRLVEVDLDGRCHRINIYEPMEVIVQDEVDNCENSIKEDYKPMSPYNPRSPQKAGKDVTKARKETTVLNLPKLPEASFKVIDSSSEMELAPERPVAYFRYIEKSTEELDEEVEYDMDEEDYAWVELINEQRRKDNQPEITHEVFEMLMDRFEKEAFFQSQTTGREQGPSIDEDAVCAICMDGECQNSNVILFCDMCNLAVHQECYGVPYIPEGQWLCRRCLQSPSRAVDCCLCPNKGGAFKQTDDGRWAHVVCALWIPEVGFANTVFLEPIDSLQHIPSARWKLTCYICKQRGTGACIQCHKTNCYTAFHVTCAQQAGLFMKIEPIKDGPQSPGGASVRKTAFCDVHTPADSDCKPCLTQNNEDEEQTLSAKKAKSRQKMRKARKILAEKRNAMPVVSIPIIPPKTLQKIASTVNLAKKNQFLARLQGFWTLKRQSRNGVPLLRRLQSNHMSRSREQNKNDKQSNALRTQLKYWQRLRQDLEKARLLVELIRKREKLKREQMRLHQLATDLRLTPFLILLRNTLDQIQEKDTGSIFAEPVDRDEVPDYYKFIERPMDFTTMRKKLEGHEYRNIDEFEGDFNLIVKNCMTYNAKDTVYYRHGVKLRDQGGAVLRAARRTMEEVGFDPQTGLHLDERPILPNREPIIIENVEDLLHVRDTLPLEEQLKILLDRMDMANAMRPGKRPKLVKQIRKEIVKVRRQLAIKNELPVSELEDGSLATSSAASETSGCRSRSQSPEKNTVSSMEGEEPVKSPPATPKAAKRGRPPRLKSTADSGHEVETSQGKDTETNVAGDTASVSSAHSHPCDTHGTSTPSPSPSGVSRRTAVLFKKNFGDKKPLHLSSPCIPIKRGPKRTPKGKGQGQALSESSPAILTTKELSSVNSSCTSAGSVSAAALSPKSPRSPKSPKPPRSPAIRKRSASAVAVSDSEAPTPTAKRSLSVTDTNPSTTTQTTAMPSSSASRSKDSFAVYRSNPEVRLLSASETEESSDLGTTDDDTTTDSESEVSEGGTRKHRVRRASAKGSGCESMDEEVVPLEPLDLVWAKCRGYPWYPALMIDPKMPKTGYFHNGVPIPVPPDDVLELQKTYDHPVFLVLFFDTKRTWQWLPRGKLEPLGVDSGLDKQKLMENKKPNVRKAVRKAFDKAVMHRCRVTGEPVPEPENFSDG